jgi:hypothetical protein
MDIEDKDGNAIIRSFGGRVAKYFDDTKQVLVTYCRSKQTDSDLENLDSLLSGEQEYDMNHSEFVISVGCAGYESGGGVLYTVSDVESLSEKDANGGMISDQEILLFSVTKTESWTT